MRSMLVAHALQVSPARCSWWYLARGSAPLRRVPCVCSRRHGHRSPTRSVSRDSRSISSKPPSQRFNQPSTTTIVAPGQFTTTLLSGDFDGSAAAWRDAERERVLLYSDPYLENRLVLVGRKGSDVSATALSALAGRRIALVEGYSYGAEVDNSGPTFVRATSEEDSLAKLLGGQVDYVLMDDLVVQYIADNHAREAQAKLQLGTRPLVKRPLYLVIRRRTPMRRASSTDSMRSCAA